MAAIVFPLAPTVGQIFPSGAGTPGVTQWQWDGTKWNVVPVFLRTNNQAAYNNYVWPATAASAGETLTDTAGGGNLNWDPNNSTFSYLDDISGAFDGNLDTFPLTQGGTPAFPGGNIVVVLGGVVQNPATAYTIGGSNIQFSNPPAPGASFVAFTV